MIDGMAHVCSMVYRIFVINSCNTLYKCFIIIQYVPISGHIALVGLGLEPLHASVRAARITLSNASPNAKDWGLEIASDGCS